MQHVSALKESRPWRRAIVAAILTTTGAVWAFGALTSGSAVRAGAIPLIVGAPTPAGTPAIGGAVTPSAVPPAVVAPVATATPSPTTPPTPTPSPTPDFTTAPRVRASGVVHRVNGYQVGAYYFSGWSHGQNDNITPWLTAGPFRKFEPLVGWYDDKQSELDRQIVQAADAGITFFAFDWYDVARSPYVTDQTLNEGLHYFLTSRQRRRLNFCINFIDLNPVMPRASDWPGLVKTWITYFKQPDYVRVDGKPLLIVFSPEHMRMIFGNSHNVHKALAYLQARARQAHLPGVTVAIATRLTADYNPGSVGQWLTEGYDVTTGYNYHALGGEKYGKPVPYKQLVRENVGVWERMARHVPIPYIPVITSGWDQRFRPAEQQTAIIYAGRTPAAFACYAAAARRWIDANARHTVKEKIALVFAWNEIGEGGAIIPNKVDGYAYVNALHAAFAARHAPTCSGVT